MIIKHYELEKLNLSNNNIFLLYGENEGLKNNIIKKNLEPKFLGSIYRYDENEVLNNKEEFFMDLFSHSFFEKKKLLIISRTTEKIKETIEEIIEKELKDTVIVLISGLLEKKSKIRQLFEKEKLLTCIPFYEDNIQTLSSLAINFFNQKKIPISSQTISLLVGRSRGDRQNLEGELIKIENFMKNKKKISIEDVLKLTNLAENYNASELIDSCLAKNKKKTVKILNENNYSIEDAIILIRTFLIKSKRLLNLYKAYDDKKNIDSAILSMKPPIFWKDKDIVKQQMRNWSKPSIKNLIYEINNTELLIKKNSSNSVNILSNFIIEQATLSNN
jgi:DNA polymerase III subunit delta